MTWSVVRSYHPVAFLPPLRVMGRCEALLNKLHSLSYSQFAAPLVQHKLCSQPRSFFCAVYRREIVYYLQ